MVKSFAGANLRDEIATLLKLADNAKSSSPVVKEEPDTRSLLLTRENEELRTRLTAMSEEITGLKTLLSKAKEDESNPDRMAMAARLAGELEDNLSREEIEAKLDAAENQINHFTNELNQTARRR